MFMVEEKVVSTHHHEVTLINRNLLEVKGVIGVESFDNEEFLLQTDYGYLGIRGQNLSVQNLNLEDGVVTIEGSIVDVSYLDVRTPQKEDGRGMLGRLFG